MQVEIFSDVVCPWCAVGKARFAAALDAFRHRDEVTVRWRSFELDPAAPPVKPGAYVDLLASKYGVDRAGAQAMIDRMTSTAAEEGLDFRFDRVQPGNSFDAHRLLHLAGDRDAAGDRGGVLQDRLVDRLFTGYLTDGLAIGEAAVLRRLATEAGLDDADVDAVLATDRYAEAVRADEAQAYAFGISGVPFFVFDRRVGVAGAQPAAVLLRALTEVHAAAATRATVVPHVHAGRAAVCTDDSCDVGVGR